MRAKRLLVLGAIGVVGLGSAAYFADPDRRLAGMVAAEPFHAGRAASAWQKDLSLPDGVRRAAAFERLESGKADGVPVLVWILRRPVGNEARWNAADVLGRIGAEARGSATALLPALDDEDPYIRTTAYKALSKFAPKPADALPPELGEVVPRLVTKFPAVEAIRVAADYKRHAAPAVPKLTELLTHADAAVRWNAARTRGKIGPDAKAALPGLLAQLADPDQAVREHACEALGDIGPAVAEATPALAKMFNDPQWKVRRDAVRATGQMGREAKGVLAEVQRLKADPEAEVRTAATTAERLIDPSLAK